MNQFILFSHCFLMMLLIFLFHQPLSNADFIIPVEIEGVVHQVGT